MAARSAVPLVCVVLFPAQQTRNSFYKEPGQAGQGAGGQAHGMLAVLGTRGVELATWAKPRGGIAAGEANAAAGAGAAVKAEAKAPRARYQET